MDIVDIIFQALTVAVGVNGVVFALAGVGLNLQFGYTGLLNFGHVAFMMLGAYGLAITVDRGGPFWLGILVGIVAAALLGLLLGLPTLRLRTDYLAIVTIAAGEILRLVFRSGFAEPLTQGVFGIQRFGDAFYRLNPLPNRTFRLGFNGDDGFVGLIFRQRTLWVVIVGWTLVLLTTGLILLLVRSPYGRVLRSIREDEDAARSLGKHVFAYKLQTLMVGGMIGGLGGMLRAIDQQSVNPDSFLPTLTFFVYVVVIFGGPGSVLGPIVGSIIFWFVIDITSGIMSELAATSDFWGDLLTSNRIALMRFVLVGLGLALLMVFRPQGLFGSREEMLLDAR